MRRLIWWHARLLPAFVGRRDLQSVLSYAAVHPDPEFAGLPAEAIAAWVVAATRRPWLMRNRRCLRQGLLGMRFMRLAGHDPELHFGIDPKSLSRPAIAAHCWVVLGGKPVLNDLLEGMEPVHTWRPA
jgi:hypothetical protein